ncbi:hypothetical protein ACWDUL_19940 [Nocardia niigatensis]|uniref:hypothetical protein n=1 Tax=Nocardia niigatensis TaxID=209249 RepID=UPI0003149C9C|nr:hypothetical protein [Nocardia niigatensis]
MTTLHDPRRATPPTADHAKDGSETTAGPTSRPSAAWRPLGGGEWRSGAEHSGPPAADQPGAPAPGYFEADPPNQPAPAAPPVPMWHRSVPNRPPRPPLVWLVGVHGGAGVSSLAASLSWAGDAGQRWPARIGLAGDLDSPLVVLVGRSHLRGVNALHRALLAHQARATPAGSQVVGVVTVSDSARPLPIPVAQRREEMEGLAVALGARTWRLGWLEQWRALEPYEMAEWDPAAGVSPVDEGDPTRTPPQPVRLLAEQILTAARIAGARITERGQHGAEPASP